MVEIKTDAFCLIIRFSDLRSLHNEYDIFVRHKEIGSGSIFCVFRIRGKHFEVFWQLRATVQANAKIQNDDCQVHPLRLAAQSTVYSPCTLSSQKLVVF